MEEYKESILIKILKFFGIIKEYEIDKQIMCDSVKDKCNKNCKMCAWSNENE